AGRGRVGVPCSEGSQVRRLGVSEGVSHAGPRRGGVGRPPGPWVGCLVARLSGIDLGGVLVSAASRKRRRQALRRGMCPNCLERPSSHEVPVGAGWHLVACIECWPELRRQLLADGFELEVVSGR
ncbi:hypothetical protein M2426_005356, partial [Pseudomonas moraviensis]